MVKNNNDNQYILCLAIPDNKMYVYSETGILIERVLYGDIAEMYGKPVEISENGLIFLFKKGQDNPEIHLIFFHIDKVEWVATINVKERLEKYMKENKDKFTPEIYEEMMSFYKKQLNELSNLKNVELTYVLNDDAEVLVEFKIKNHDDHKLEKLLEDKQAQNELKKKAK